MTKLIDNTAFVGRYYVANNTDAAIAAQLNYLVTTYQPVFLRLIMGPKKASEFQAWLDITPLERPVNATWTALLTSGLFTNERGEDEHREAITKPLTSFCYNEWQRANVTQTTSSGEAMTLAQNAEPGSPQQKLIDRQLESVEYCKGIYDYLSVQFKTDADWLRWIRSFSGFSIWADFPTRYPNNALFEKVNQFGL